MQKKKKKKKGDIWEPLDLYPVLSDVMTNLTRVHFAVLDIRSKERVHVSGVYLILDYNKIG